jgi:hypothetical protein
MTISATSRARLGGFCEEKEHKPTCRVFTHPLFGIAGSANVYHCSIEFYSARLGHMPTVTPLKHFRLNTMHISCNQLINWRRCSSNITRLLSVIVVAETLTTVYEMPTVGLFLYEDHYHEKHI